MQALRTLGTKGGTRNIQKCRLTAASGKETLRESMNWGGSQAARRNYFSAGAWLCRLGNMGGQSVNTVFFRGQNFYADCLRPNHQKKSIRSMNQETARMQEEGKTTKTPRRVLSIGVQEQGPRLRKTMGSVPKPVREHAISATIRCPRSMPFLLSCPAGENGSIEPCGRHEEKDDFRTPVSKVRMEENNQVAGLSTRTKLDNPRKNHYWRRTKKAHREWVCSDKWNRGTGDGKTRCASTRLRPPRRGESRSGSWIHHLLPVKHAADQQGVSISGSGNQDRTDDTHGEDSKLNNLRREGSEKWHVTPKAAIQGGAEGRSWTTGLQLI